MTLPVAPSITPPYAEPVSDSDASSAILTEPRRKKRRVSTLTHSRRKHSNQLRLQHSQESNQWLRERNSSLRQSKDQLQTRIAAGKRLVAEEVTQNLVKISESISKLLLDFEQDLPSIEKENDKKKRKSRPHLRVPQVYQVWCSLVSDNRACSVKDLMPAPRVTK